MNDEPFDIGGLVYGDRAELAIKTQDGKTTSWKVTVRGPGHPSHAEMQRRLLQFNDANARQEAMAKKRNEVWVRDAQAETELWRDLFADRILDWSPVRFAGKDFPCDAANRRALFAEARFAFVAEQINSFASDLESFTRKTDAS